MPKLLIAASGTGGHIYPALAIAEALPGHWQSKWIGVPDRLEKLLVPEKYELITVAAGGLQKNLLNQLLRIFQALAAIQKIRRLINKEKIQVVFTTGGYIAAPAILAARTCGIPVLLHESNVIPGKVTRFMGRFCNVVATGLPTTGNQIPNTKPILTGTPVRPEFYLSQTIPKWVPTKPGPLIIIFGGSQGAIGLNRMVRPLFPSLLKEGCRIVHLTGKNDRETTQINHPNLIEKEFSEEVPALLQHADLAISRAGSGSISELAICNTPSILVPFPDSTDHHQDANAACVAAIGGAVIVHQHAPEADSLKKTVFRLLKSRLSNNNEKEDLLIKMSMQMQKLTINDPERRLIDILERLV